MRSKIERHRAGSALAILRLVTMLVLAAWVIGVARLALAENGASQNVPHSQADSGYWTPEKKRSAKPLMPTVPGTPESGSTVSRPSGPTGGSPGQGPEVQPNLSEQRQ
jgi:hypothetical protein